VAKRAVRGDRNAVVFAPRDYGVLGGTLLQVIKHLIAGEAVLAGYRPGFFEV
jgi:hypothetical protein